MKKLFIAVLVIIFTVSAPVSAFADSKGVLPSGIMYSDIEGAIDSYAAEHKATTAAVSVAVFNGSEVLMEKAYGYSDIENIIVNDEETVFEWGSCTKLLVWASVMQLVEKGRIDLNRDIREYLPDGFLKKLRYKTPVTMLNLMNHNAGWQETVTDLFLENKEDVRELGAGLQLIEPVQIYEPGKVVAYSNWGTALAGYIVERVSGQPFLEYVHEHIFDPLGMEHTAIGPTLSDNEWVAAKRREEKCYTTNNVSLGTNIYYLSLYPAGMTTGTMGDFIKFAQAFLVPGGKKSPLFEKRETLDEMLSPTLYFADGKTPRNSHGFWADELGVPVLYHNGGTPGSSSWFAFDSKSGTGIIVLTNQNHEYVYNCGLLPLVFGKYKGSASKVQSEDISGSYVTSRTCFKGFAKPYSLITAKRFKAKGDGTYIIPGSNSTVTPLGSNSYLMDLGGLKQYVVYSTTDEEGHRVLQLFGEDYMEVNGYGVIAQYILLGMLILSALYSFFALFISFIGFLRHKKSLGKMGICRNIVNASIIMGLAMFVYITVKLFSPAPSIEDIKWSIILNGILALIPVAYGITLAARWSRLALTRKERRKLIITAVAGFIMTANMIFWQSYKF